MADNNQRFNSNTLKKLAETIRKQKNNSILNLSNEIVDFVKSVYKEETQKAVTKDVDATSVKLKLPSNIVKKVKKLDNDSFAALQETIGKAMIEDGFKISINYRGYSCKYGCMFQPLCNKLFKVTISW